MSIHITQYPISFAQRNTGFLVKRRVESKCKAFEESDDSYRNALSKATHAAFLRFLDSKTPEPLIHDPYAACFTEFYEHKEASFRFKDNLSKDCYCLATRFIDDKLLENVNTQGNVRQVVLFTDGMDTRPFRLKWPNRTTIFDISHESIFQMASKRIKDVGGKVPKSVLLKHVSSELLDIQLKLKSMGYVGHKPSIWVIQGFILTSSKIFNDIVRHVSCLAMKDSLFLGEVPCSDSITDFRPEGYTRKLVEDVLRKNGFAVSLFSYEDLITELNRKLIGKEPYSLDVSSGEKTSFLFVAKQQRLSDDQVDYIRREMELLEDAGDEEGFEDLY